MRKICVFTSTRADYGLLKNLIREISCSAQLHLQLLVSGSHLVGEQGMTIEEIRRDGFEPDRCVDIELTDDSPEGICRSMGIAIAGYGKFFVEFDPDIVVVLGDRSEAFCCASAAQICRIPIAHIHGGETTQGAVDEAFRHCITKMAHLHFPCCEEYKRRIVQLGECAEKVHNVGALGVENIRTTQLMDRLGLERAIGFKLDRPFFLITFHPVTLENRTSQDQVAELLVALDEYSDHKLIFTGANADTDGRIINKILDEFVATHSHRCLKTPSLGYLRYLSAMQFCDAVIGNSSSGILEAPVFKVPTINIGDRQKGRLRTPSIVDCEPTRKSILAALYLICSMDFKSNLENMEIPHEKDGTAKKIKKIIETADFTNVLKKKFVDYGSDGIFEPKEK